MNNVQRKSTYRVEERYRTPVGEEPTMSIATWDRQPLTAESGWKLLEYSRRQFPGRYVPGGLYRLVLIGPDHEVLPGGVR